MSKRLLSALEYPDAESVNINDDASFRKIVVWLETTKIRRGNNITVNRLRNTNAGDWNNTFVQYKNEIGCPPLSSYSEELRWILGVAVQTETSKNKNLYVQYAVDNIKTSNVPSVVAENPLDKLDFRCDEFSARVNQLAKNLRIAANHPDPLVTLKAIRKVIVQRMAPSCVENPQNHIVTGTPFPFQEFASGFDFGDNVLNEAATILRLLYIHDLRDLQTKANELIVAVQNVTANPKTDTRLGQVGR